MHNESDVEQKFIYPFLSYSPPMGLGYNNSEIFTKETLRQRKIGKSNPRYYYPDYVIYLRGCPVLVVEVKTPGIDVYEAYAEARLYAQEINSQFSHNINPCQRILISNGELTIAGYFDSDEPTYSLGFNKFNIEDIEFIELSKFCSKDQLENIANDPYIKARGSSVYKTPVSQVGSRRAQDSEMIENTYGRTLVFDNRNIFDPETEKDRSDIVDNAYVSSKKREQHLDPMYKELIKLQLPSYQNTTHIATSKPDELVDKLSQRIIEQNQAYSLMIIVGNVGSGKTTFVRYFKRKYIEDKHPELSQRYEWIFIDMNSAPVNSEEIYFWLMSKVNTSIKIARPDIDFDELEMLKIIYKQQIEKFEKGVGKLLKDNVQSYKTELISEIRRLTSDVREELIGLIDYLKSYCSKIPIIVLDNCDKRNREEQLLMFEVAQWFRETYKCVVILPMRNDTYDTFKNEKPLDTVVKDLVFRIDSPDLLRVLQARIDYIIRLFGADKQSHIYQLENGMKVHISKNEQSEYAKSILMNIRNNSWAKHVFYSLSDRNTRYGIQLFEDLCRSGHIGSTEIFKVRVGGDEYSLPNHLVMNALLRKNRRYYNGESSNFVNLFYSNAADDFPDPFVRLDIIRYLTNRNHVVASNGIKGYVRIDSTIKVLQAMGHREEVVVRELTYLLKRKLIFIDSKEDSVEYGALTKLSPSGKLHMQLLSNVSYLAACAEDVNYRNSNVMVNISNRIASNAHLDKSTILCTARDMVNYLEQYQSTFVAQPETILKSGAFLMPYDFSECRRAIDSFMSTDAALKRVIELMDKYPNGTEIICEVVSKKNNSLLCVFNDEVRGFLATTDEKYNLNYDEYIGINVDTTLICKVLEYSHEHNSFQLSYVGTCDDEKPVKGEFAIDSIL